ncbi:MAG: extracellular solute-binding protein [Cyanobacteria bacterium LVE1205-1]|jgi:putative spermidine/putrescine transport system substrate-binding protein
MFLPRRTFLTGTGLLALDYLLTACDSGASHHFQVRLLKDSIPSNLFQEFRKQLPQSVKLDVSSEKQLSSLYEQLESWHRPPRCQKNNTGFSPFWTNSSISPTVPDLITIGDYWLSLAIQHQVIRPLNFTDFPAWSQLPQFWRSLVHRDSQGRPSPTGSVWGAPYRWGATVLIYRQDVFERLGWVPSDWGDLWRPELKGRISLLNQPREIIGLTLKRLGHSYNTPVIESIPNLKAYLTALHHQARFYSNDTYLQPLLLEDTWLAVGWSSDVIPLLAQGRLAAVIPASGSALWADLWVKPVRASQPTDFPDLTQRWINYCWQLPQAVQLSLLTSAASPMLATFPPSRLPPSLRQNSIFNPTPQLFNRCEWLSPMTENSQQQYARLWQSVRSQ